MDFATHMQTWVKSEVLQGRVMIIIGLLVLIACIGILRAQNELLRGALIPLGILVVLMIGYGGYIMSSRPAHAKESLAKYDQSEAEALLAERAKHVQDNAFGKTLTRYVYPSLVILSVILLMLLGSPYYKGMAWGFALLFIAAYAMDSGFVSRSDAFIAFLDGLPQRS